MFEFLFKRRPASTNISPADVTSLAEGKQKETEHQKNTVKNASQRTELMERIQTLTKDENALVEIVLSCDFADGRFSAAQHVHSQEALRKIAMALRNTDKRVVKLMQSRLDDIATLDRQRQLAIQYVEQAQRLVHDEKLIPQQLIELDKLTAKLSVFPDDLKQEFDHQYQTLQARIVSQTALQRKIIDLSHLLAASMGIADAEHAAQLDQWQNEFDQLLSDPEAPGLPKNLLSDFTEKMQAVRQQWVWLQTQKSNPEEAVVRSDMVHEQMPADDAESNAHLSSNVVVSEDDESTSVAVLPISKIKSAIPVTPAVSAVSTEQIIKAIEAMELALEQGSALQAQKIEREILRGVDVKRSSLASDQKERLFKVQSELGRLLSWAKWGGSISRDELIKTAENLPVQELEPNELAKKIGGLRERWKSLEASSGGASKEIWDRFDAACNLAYAPAAAYFQQLAQGRSENLKKAEALLTDWRNKADALLASSDWKSAAHFLNELKQAWRESGNVDRKHKQRLDTTFNTLYQCLSQPLELQRKTEIDLREQLIQQVTAIDSARRDAVDQLKQLQARWQERALALPLRRKDEQQLWEKFRAACDALFMQRKATIGQIDEERKSNLATKLAICARVEQVIVSAEQQDQFQLQLLLREITQAWRETGAVPRNEDDAIEKKFQAICSQLKYQIEQARESDAQAARHQLQSKFDLCQQVERQLSENLEQSKLSLAKWVAEWNHLSQKKAVSTLLDQALNKRFTAWMQAVESGDVTYADQLSANAEIAGKIILQLEILNGIDSPAELSRLRLQMQVDVLQETLKSGNKHSASLEQLQRLYSTPAVLEPSQQQRVARLLKASNI
ncbi:DUF349 domain-containing protein [Undibacterium sp. RuTC16W]|uniref:DUF349 domain-containing protein n=1 Tax=Undibacterium sp. RuTC16W TaxID=3413048 RepID=UPI003BF28A56